MVQMTDKDFQKDFFEEGVSYLTTVKKPRRIKRYSEKRLLAYIRIPVEYIVILSIGVLVLLIISYAVGVKSGETRMNAKFVVSEMPVIGQNEVLKEDLGAVQLLDSEPLVQKEPVKLEEPVTEDVPGKIEENFDNTDNALILGEEIVTTSEKASSTRDGSVYIIQLASFKNEKSAQKEIHALEQMNLNVEVVKKGEWYQVSAVGYETIKEAKDAKEKLTETYTDCYIKRIE
ncbi:MAG: SPOR domain-containing protein [Candidatus Omnitrophota bacterium]|nr:SPOR domain-containing protein [Candidatus Omnitrophota bacterium]